MSMNEMITTTGQDIQPMDLMERAIATGADPVVLEKLMTLHERWEASRAHKAYAAAIADAKAEFKKITKSRSVDFSTTRGRTNYRFEDMNDIAEAIDEPLSKHGLSYRWRTVSDMQKSIHTVTCIISHRDGYSEENSLTAVSDNTGNKNNIQAVGSTVTYLQRYTLKSALGLTVSDDDDARGAGDPISSGIKPKPPAATIVVPAEVPVEEPFQMEPPDAGADATQAWHDWCRKFMGYVRTSTDIATHLKWIDLNIDTLELLKEQEPTMRANLGNSLNKNHEALRTQKDAQQ